MYLIYSALLAAGLLVSLPYWMLQRLRHGKYRLGCWLQRRGPESGFTQCESARFWRSAAWCPN